MRMALAAMFLLAIGATAQPVTNNDASCDISVAPAATLLLLLFEVNLTAPAGTGETTIFTVTNTGKSPQIARVTLWTDLAYPVFTFNIPLAGYEAQSINLFDVLGRGEIRGRAGSCANFTPRLDPPVRTRMQRAFTRGTVNGLPPLPDCPAVGARHANAIGYATIDVVGDCDSSMPTDREYFSNDIRFDNVLLGDYQQINGDEDFAQGTPMVHIRAIPEVMAPRTFYGLYQHPARPSFDARQPLPSLFAARWIDGPGVETHYKIWRESLDDFLACAGYAQNFRPVREVVRFDEDENVETTASDYLFLGPSTDVSLRATSVVDAAAHHNFPDNSDGAVGGWMYFNLDGLNRVTPHPSQGWVTISMRAQNRFSIDFDAAYLGNGCSAPVDISEATAWGGPPIGPAPNKRQH